jgi:hypothetical protein
MVVSFSPRNENTDGAAGNYGRHLQFHPAALALSRNQAACAGGSVFPKPEPERAYRSSRSLVTAYSSAQ